MPISMPQLLILLFVFLGFLLPIILVLASNRSSGLAKFGWFVGTLFFSWVAYVVFRIRTEPVAKSQSS